MKKNYRIFASLGMLIFVVACVSSTSIIGVWSNPQATPKSYKNICVAAITQNNINRNTVEQSMQTRLQNKKVTAVPLSRLIDLKYAGTPEEKAAIVEKVKANGNDAIITFKLVKQKDVTTYVPGSASYYGSYGTFGGYYGYPRGVYMYEPGYVTHDEIYIIETNLYDIATEQLVWSAHSKTLNPTNINSFADEFTRAITYQLMKAKLIQPDRSK